MVQGQNRISRMKFEDCINQIVCGIELFEFVRWGNKPACPRCNSINVCQIKNNKGHRNKRFLWWCRGCKKQYTVRIGTEIENSRLSIDNWIYAILECKNAFQIHKKLNISYKSALFMMERLDCAEIIVALNKLVKKNKIKRVKSRMFQSIPSQEPSEEFHLQHS